MAMPKGQPPKKRTKKYGERKSCKILYLHSWDEFILKHYL
jgi:hypothetical protein